MIKSLGAAADITKQGFRDRLVYARENTTGILKKVWICVIVAIGIGGFIHGHVLWDFLVNHAGPQNTFGVPIAVAPGLPLDSNAAGVIPIVYALMVQKLGIEAKTAQYQGTGSD